MIDDDQVILVSEYAAGFDRYELGCPKGIIEQDEDPLVAANREIQEEIGFAARDLKILHKVTLAPGYLGSQTYIVIARDLYPSHLPGDEPEAIETVNWSLNNLDALFAREDFTEARSMLALLMVKNNVKKQNLDPLLKGDEDL
jgi:ADP-ribose diphosphatase